MITGRILEIASLALYYTLKYRLGMSLIATNNDDYTFDMAISKRIELRNRRNRSISQE